MAKYVQPNFIVDSSAAFLRNVTFDSSVYLQGATHISSPAATGVATPHALVVETVGADVVVKSIQLGTMATKQAADYDASLNAIRTKDTNQDSSIAALDALTQTHTSDIAQLDASVVRLDTAVVTINASINGINAYQAIQDASIAAVGGAWKPYVDASLLVRDASITALKLKDTQIDASIIRIDASLNDVVDAMDLFYGKDYVDGSFGARDISIAYLNAQRAIHEVSLGTFAVQQQDQDVSIALALAGTTKAWNGLTRTDNSIGLGGSLQSPTTITANSVNTLSLAGLQTSTAGTPLAVVQESANGPLMVRALGTMAWETASNYTLRSLFDSSVAAIYTKFGNVDTSLASVWTKLGQHDTSILLLNNWNVSQDASIVRIDASLNSISLNALKTASNGLTATDQNVELGGLLTKNTTIDGNGTYSLSVLGNFSVAGNFTVDGSVTHVNSVNLDVSDNIIVINAGETGAGVSKQYAGLLVDRGSETDYFFGFMEGTDTFRIGIQNESGLPANTQAVATREDTPEGFGIGFWNASQYMISTSEGFTFTPGVGLGLPIVTNQGTEKTVLSLVDGLVGSVELGTMAFEALTSFYTKTEVNSLIADVSSALDTRLDHIDTSIAGLDTLTISHTASIADLSTNKLDAVASTPGVGNVNAVQVYSGEADNIAYIKQLVPGVGVTLTQDASTITIAADNTVSVKKYAGTFNGGTGTSLTITAATHLLGTGPLSVTVYDGVEQVFTGVDCAANGDITLSWSSGSLGATCKYIIMG